MVTKGIAWQVTSDASAEVQTMSCDSEFETNFGNCGLTVTNSMKLITYHDIEECLQETAFLSSNWGTTGSHCPCDW
jgi:hypothetical protein